MIIKLFTILSFFYIFTFADRIGFGTSFSNTEYKNKKNSNTIPMPVFNIDRENYYLRQVELGLKIVKSNNMNVNMILKPRFKSYEAKNVFGYENIKTRDTTIESGIKIDFKPNKYMKIKTSILHDILSKYKGYNLDLQLSTMVFISKEIFAFPFVSRTYYSKKFVNYYYGISHNESSTILSQYQTDATFTNALGINVIYKITPKLIFNTLIKHTYFEDEITQSPLVGSDTKTSYILGLNYSF